MFAIRRSNSSTINIQGTKLTGNVSISKLSIHAINGPYPLVGLQCRNKHVHIWYQSRLAAIDRLM